MVEAIRQDLSSAEAEHREIEEAHDAEMTKQLLFEDELRRALAAARPQPAGAAPAKSPVGA